MKKLSNTEAELKKSVTYKRKSVAEEELDCTDIYNIGNLENECWNLRVANDGRELTRNIKRK